MSNLTYLDEKDVVRVDQTPVPVKGNTRQVYGGAIPTRYRILLTDNRGWRRVYMMVYGNSGTAYITVKGEQVIVADYFFNDIVWVD